VLPAQPPAPGAPWPASTGSSFSQVGFNRADFIANKFRRSVRLIGVGVGVGINQSSNWIVDPGAGYRDVVERGSYSHVRQDLASTYQARYQKKNSTNGPWYFVDKPTYLSAATNRRQDVGWTTISESMFNSINTRLDDENDDGLSVSTTTVSTPVSTAEYNANVPNLAYQVVAKTWNNGPDWEVWTGAQTGSSTHYRTSRVFNSPPYTGYLPAQTASTQNSTILARLISGNDNGTPAVWNGSSYTNAAVADMYVTPNWSQFGTALEAVALGECGGTLTLQTKLGGTTPAADPFRYQNSAVTDSAGAPVALKPTVVTTNQQFVTGTFDFAVPNGQFITVDILPLNYSELKAYTPGAWSCRAGNQPRPFELIDIPDAGAWKGVRVRVAANEAVSCTLAVSK
jgi:hypothetical protein